MGSLFTRTGADHVAPKSNERDTNTSVSPLLHMHTHETNTNEQHQNRNESRQTENTRDLKSIHETYAALLFWSTAIVGKPLVRSSSSCKGKQTAKVETRARRRTMPKKRGPVRRIARPGDTV